jgi:hypothetical protein
VAEVLTKKPDVVDAVLSIMPDSSPEQASAIGAGLVRAMRGLLGKNPELVTQISEKILRSENVALKTTFFALGPRKVTYASAGPSIPMQEYRSQEMGGGGEKMPGEALEKDRSRIDVPRTPYIYPRHALREVVENPGGRIDTLRVGMIVALISEDAAAVGTVSTSPTH